MVCVHGITDTWRTWELVLPVLERYHDVLAATLPGHAGGQPIADGFGHAELADAVERAMDDAGFETAHIVGNSLGGYISLRLAERGRAESVVALAPAGGWAMGDPLFANTYDHFRRMRPLAQAAAPHAEAIVATEEGRRRATEFTSTNFDHIPAELLAHQICGVAGCDGLVPLGEHARREGWPLDPRRIRCPVRVIWGTADRVLPWPRAAVRFREELLPHADWVELEGVGHLLQLDVPRETAELILGFTEGRSGAAPAAVITDS